MIIIIVIKVEREIFKKAKKVVWFIDIDNKRPKNYKIYKRKKKKIPSAIYVYCIYVRHT